MLTRWAYKMWIVIHTQFVSGWLCISYRNDSEIINRARMQCRLTDKSYLKLKCHCKLLMFTNLKKCQKWFQAFNSESTEFFILPLEKNIAPIESQFMAYYGQFNCVHRTHASHIPSNCYSTLLPFLLNKWLL